MKRIKITVAPGGTAKIEVSGFQGKACLAATKEIEEAIGKVTKRTPTREMGTGQATQTQTQET